MSLFNVNLNLLVSTWWKSEMKGQQTTLKLSNIINRQAVSSNTLFISPIDFILKLTTGLSNYFSNTWRNLDY